MDNWERSGPVPIPRLGGLVVFHALGHAVLELFLGLTDRASEFGQLGAAENHKNDDQYDDELCCSEIHGSSLAGTVCDNPAVGFRP